LKRLIRTVVTLFTVVLVGMVLPVAPARAVTGNFVPDSQHVFVGLVVFYDANGEFSHRCSGSLLTPTVFLTAGHCVDGATSARVYLHQYAGANFDPATGIDATTGYPETCIDGDYLCTTASRLYNYGYFAGFPNTADVGLVLLDSPIDTGLFGALAQSGSLDALATQRGHQDVTFTVSGYGLSRSNPNFVESFRSRLMATSKLVNLNSANNGGFNLQTSANPGGGRGGTCFGDSGGPVFYSSTNTIVGVTSFGLNQNCVGVDFAYRTDQQAVIDWIIAIVSENVSPEEASMIQIVPL